MELCTPFSSSTISIAGRAIGAYCDSGLSQGQINNDPGADRHIRFRTHGSMMIRDDLAHDGQSQARASSSGGKVGQEYAVLVLLGKAATCIADLNPDRFL